MKIRVAFGLTESGRFLGHLDLSRNWYRLLRRAQLPLAYSQGYSPKPKLAFGSALSVGTTSAAEYVDVGLAEVLPLADIRERLRSMAPAAYDIKCVGELKPGSPAVMSVINRAAYDLTLAFTEPVGQEHLDAAIRSLWAKETLPIMRFKKDSRKNKIFDIRPGIHSLKGISHESGEQATIEMMLTTGASGNVKADEVIYAFLEAQLLPVKNIERRHRTGLYIVDGDTIKTPMDTTYCLHIQ